MNIVIVDTENEQKSGRMWQIGIISVDFIVQKDRGGGVSIIERNKVNSNFKPPRPVQLSSTIKMLNQADLIVGHNIAFDMRMLSTQAFKQGFTMSANLNRKTACTMSFGRSFKKLRRNISLQDLYTVLFRKPFIGWHDALKDAEATYEIFKELVIRGKIIL